MRKIYSYGAARDVTNLVIFCIICTIWFYVSLLGDGAKLDETTMIIFQRIYWLILMAVVVLFIIFIFDEKQQKLEISDLEVHYLFGLLTKNRISISISKIQSCRIESSTLQRVFGLSTLRICAAGDSSEIRFVNIKDGEDAYDTIMNMRK